MPSPFLRLVVPSQNPLGFGPTDFIGVGLATLLVLIFLARTRLLSVAKRLADRPIVCMAVVAALPVALRLALLPHHPVPKPRVADDFSYLLLGDTLAHLRLANPMHPIHRFFEAVFVLQEPSYSSIFPLGQGIILAFGQLLFGQPWAGVILSVGALCALCYWMLRAWIAPAWALLGGLLAALEFGPLSPWMNSYWGGAVSGIAGCLVFGSLPRLRRNVRTRDAVLLGIGLGLQLLTRPFEFVLLTAAVILFLLPFRSVPFRSVAIAALVMLPAVGLTLLQNKAVTRNWMTLPYQLSRYQYGIPATFTFQANPIPHRPLTVEQQIDYDAQAAVHGNQSENLRTYVDRLITRFRFLRFFFLAPLYLALPGFLPALRQRRFFWVAIAITLFWVGDGIYPYFYTHYIAAVACLFLLVTVQGLETLSGIRIRNFPFGAEAVTLILAVCLAHFVFWYGVQLSGNRNLLTATAGDDSWDSLNYGDSEGRIAIDKRLAESQGKQLVFVRYWPQHQPQEWIQNRADIDQSAVVWAIDLGAEENETLRRYYPGRKAWILEPDAHPPRLTPY